MTREGLAMGRYDDDDDDDWDDDDSGLDIRRKRKRRRGSGSSDAAARLMGPAIGIMVVAMIHLVLGCLFMPCYLLSLAGHGLAMAHGAGFNPSAFANIGGHFVILLAQGFLVFGATQMKSQKMYGVSLATAILSLIPCFCSSCAILGIPFGIWGLVVLMDENVKASFES